MALATTHVFADIFDLDGLSLLSISDSTHQFSKTFFDVSMLLKLITKQTKDFYNLVKIFQALKRDESSNSICSPFGVNLILSMLYFGARGTTKKLLETSLKLPQDENFTVKGYQQLIDSLSVCFFFKLTSIH